MTDKNKGLIRAIVGVSAVLACVLCYRAGYQAGVLAGAKTIAEVQSDEKLTEPQRTGESAPLASRVVLKRDDHTVAKPSIAGLTRIVRFKRSDSKERLYSAEPEGSNWKEDLALGYPDGQKDDSVLFKCPGETGDHQKYTFVTTSADCYGLSKSAKETGTFVARRMKDRLHLPVYVCVTPEKVFYPTLNYRCEDPTDTLRDLVGYFLTAEVVRQ